MQKLLTYILPVLILMYGCSKDDTLRNSPRPNPGPETGWTVPLNQLVLTSQPPDYIPSIDTPYFEVLDTNNINPKQTVLVYRHGNVVKIYPENILWSHEIVNDHIGDHYFAITYCPLTGSAVAWDRTINGKITEFGVSGHLYNENLIPYDRNSNSFWSQMQLEGIKGKNAGDQLKSNFLLSTTGATIINSFPEALVLVDNTSYTSKSKIINMEDGKKTQYSSHKSANLSSGDYFGIVKFAFAKDPYALLFNYSVFDDSIKIIRTNFPGSKLIVIGSKNLNFILAFKDKSGSSTIQYFPVQNSLPEIFYDSDGNFYDITGLAVSGPLTGSRLTAPNSYMAHSFAWDLFFGENIELFE